MRARTDPQRQSPSVSSAASAALLPALWYMPASRRLPAPGGPADLARPLRRLFSGRSVSARQQPETRAHSDVLFMACNASSTNARVTQVCCAHHEIGVPRSRACRARWSAASCDRVALGEGRHRIVHQCVADAGSGWSPSNFCPWTICRHTGHDPASTLGSTVTYTREKGTHRERERERDVSRTRNQGRSRARGRRSRRSRVGRAHKRRHGYGGGGAGWCKRRP